jgi:hypothetical protein
MQSLHLGLRRLEGLHLLDAGAVERGTCHWKTSESLPVTRSPLLVTSPTGDE